MKNKILLTGLLAIIGLFTFSLTADAHRGNRGHRGQHKHVIVKRGRTVIIWHNNNQRCNFRNNGFNRGNRMCSHMRGMMNRGCNRGTIRCNSRGCGMFGQRYNGRNGNQWGYNDRGRGGNGKGYGRGGNGRNGNGRGGNGRGGNGRNGNGRGR